LNPYLSLQAYERLTGLVAKREKHGKLVFGGKSDASERYLAPTCIDYGSDLKRFAKSEIMQDEIFGPILPVARYSKFEDAVQYARTLPTGKPLALYFFSQNQANIQTIKKRTTSGGLVINDVLMHLVNHDLPFGGVGASGMGSYHGERSFNTFTHEKVKDSLLRGVEGVELYKDG
jgi:aldehyde dehydrogenase (NAD+)